MCGISIGTGSVFSRIYINCRGNSGITKKHSMWKIIALQHSFTSQERKRESERETINDINEIQKIYRASLSAHMEIYWKWKGFFVTLLSRARFAWTSAFMCDSMFVLCVILTNWIGKVRLCFNRCVYVKPEIQSVSYFKKHTRRNRMWYDPKVRHLYFLFLFFPLSFS